MQAQGSSYPGTLEGTTRTTTAARNGPPSALAAGVALAQQARQGGPPGNWVSPYTRGAIPARQANTGMRIGQHPSTRRPIPADRVRPIKVTEAEHGGDHDASQYVYTVVPWNENAAESQDNSAKTHLEPGDPVFVQTLTVQKHVLSNMLNAGQLNSTLEANLATFRSRVLSGNPAAVRFNDYLKKFGENMLRVYHEKRVSGNIKHLAEAGDAEELLQLKDFYKMATDKDYYSLTLFGIMQTWNFVGFVRTTSDPLRTDGAQRLGYSRVLAVNVTVKGEVQSVAHLWKGYKTVPAQSKLYFVLTRPMTDRGPGSFKFVPWGSRMRESIPISLLTYVDQSGMRVCGHSVYVGTVNLAANKEPPETARLIASGIIWDTPHMQREAGAQLTQRLGQLRVEVGIF